MKRVLFIVLFCVLSQNVLANCNAGSCIGIKDEVLKSIYPTQGGKVYFEAPSDKANLNCSLAEGHYMVLEPSHPLFKETYSTVLTAMSAGRRLQIRIVEESSNCRVAYVRMWN